MKRGAALSELHKQRIAAALQRVAAAKRPTEKITKAADLYATGKTCAAIAEELDVGITTVWRWLKSEGIATVSSAERLKGREWPEARRAHHPKKPARQADAPHGHEIVTARSIGNKSRTGHGYITVHVGRKRKQYEHILVAERAMGRSLRQGEVVHHINCNRTDNRPENLLVCTIQYHLQLHKRMRRHPYWSAIANTTKE
jgi:hypothetical protein